MLPVRSLAANGLDAWAQAVANGYEGYVAKDGASASRGGPTRSWLKVKVSGWIDRDDRWKRLRLQDRVETPHPRSPRSCSILTPIARRPQPDQSTQACRPRARGAPTHWSIVAWHPLSLPWRCARDDRTLPLGAHCRCGGVSGGKTVGAFPGRRSSCEANDCVLTSLARMSTFSWPSFVDMRWLGGFPLCSTSYSLP